MPTRGVLYIKWGSGFQELLARSTESLKTFHPRLPVHVAELPDGSTLLDKASMLELSPFDQTLFLDADTVVLDDLTYGFRQAERFGLACSICECPWARRYAGLTARGDLTEYNTGVLFFTRQAKPVFDTWNRLSATVDSSVLNVTDGQLGRMPCNDQASFAQAIDETGFCPWVLPHNWNFRPYWHFSFFGPIKIWHAALPVPAEYVQWNTHQTAPGGLIRFASTRT